MDLHPVVDVVLNEERVELQHLGNRCHVVPLDGQCVTEASNDGGGDGRSVLGSYFVEKVDPDVLVD